MLKRYVFVGILITKIKSDQHNVKKNLSFSVKLYNIFYFKSIRLSVSCKFKISTFEGGGFYVQDFEGIPTCYIMFTDFETILPI